MLDRPYGIVAKHQRLELVALEVRTRLLLGLPTRWLGVRIRTEKPHAIEMDEMGG